jgi:hypothetical protein
VRSPTSRPRGPRCASSRRSLSVIANFLNTPAYPVWSLTVMAIDVFVIYALTAHGRDLD